MNKISTSFRAFITPASAIRRLVPLADYAKKRGIKVYHVNIGQPDLHDKPLCLVFWHHLPKEQVFL